MRRKDKFGGEGSGKMRHKMGEALGESSQAEERPAMEELKTPLK